ncbi:hypothetical protein Tco_0927071 [Tanacetum coccineum]|uniref:Uncharacterized protein n=1 Tax=Tanacetum coccineum TaxID=301880 RepID=A0ABQ5DCQ8_9ASTR
MATIILTLEEYVKNAKDEYGWMMVETEVLNLLKISDDLFSCETPLGMTFKEFKRLSSINDDLFSYEVKIPKPTYAPCVEQQTDCRSRDFESYQWKISYKECEKIYAEAVILIDKRLVRLIDVTVEKMLDLKYGDHKTMDENVKKGVIATWLIKSYKRQFEDYLEIKKQRDTYRKEPNLEYNPSNLSRGDDEVELTNEEISNYEEDVPREVSEMAEIFKIETDLFDFETPLCKTFKKFNCSLKEETYLFARRTEGFRPHGEIKNNWINMWKKVTPWIRDEVPYEEIDHICEPFRFKDGKTKWPTCNWNDDRFCNGGELPGMIRLRFMTYFQDYEWYNNLIDGNLKKEALRQKAIYEESWGDVTQGARKFYAWLKRCFDNFHKLDYNLLIKLEEYWWKVDDDECSPFTNWRNLTSITHKNNLEEEDNPKSDPYLDIYRTCYNSRKDGR